MTPEEMTYQQVIAAWVSAAAAVTQAVGAVAAIWVSMKLARDSAQREIKAQQEAQRRIDAADQAAEARIEREVNSAYNMPIMKAIALIDLAAAETERFRDTERPRFVNFGGTIMGSLNGPNIRSLMDAIPDLKLSMPAQEPIHILAFLKEGIDLRGSVSRSGQEYINYIDAQLNILQKASDRLKNILK